jgi:hypothetical protein
MRDNPAFLSVGQPKVAVSLQALSCNKQPIAKHVEPKAFMQPQNLTYIERVKKNAYMVRAFFIS